MQFLDAVTLMEDGAYMYRPSWVIQDGYVALMPGMTHIWKFTLNSERPNVGEARFSRDDYKATDWEVYTVAKQEVKLDLCQETPDAA